MAPPIDIEVQKPAEPRPEEDPEIDHDAGDVDEDSNVNVILPFDPQAPHQFQVEAPVEGVHANPVVPLNVPRSSYERRASFQANIGHASEEGVALASNSLHIELLARKTPVDGIPKPGFQTLLYPAFCNGQQHSNPDAFTITRANFQAYLESHPDPVKSKYAVVDLRDSNNKSDLPPTKDGRFLQIKGALHLQVSESIDKGDTFSLSQIKRSTKRSLNGEEISNAKAKWRETLKNGPLSSLKDKDIVFFHCRQSINRTPYMADGYLNYGRPEGSHQKVVIIEHGYNNYDWGNLTEEFKL